MAPGSEQLDETLDFEEKDTPIGRCGDPLRVPVPKEGNHWEKLLRPLVEKDRQQCGTWKEEVENLLIFAGLFSAVVTAFVVQTSTELQTDPNDAVITLLAHIAASLDIAHNGTASQLMTAAVVAPQTPPAGMIRVNALWFISLVLSLTDVLVGTVALQWLRAHQQYPVAMDPRTKFAVFNMRREALEAWYVPRLFSALPMVLQLSLVLFFWGLIEFLSLIAPAKVLVPVTVFIALPNTFLIFTTIAPSFQCIFSPNTFFYLFKVVPSECPYKSPQSSALRSLISPAPRILWDIHQRRGGGLQSWYSFYFDLLTRSTGSSSSDGGLLALRYRARCQEEEYRYRLAASVGSYQRYKAAPYDYELDDLSTIRPVHDWLTGLYLANMDASAERSVQEACYQCVQEISNIRVKAHRFRSHVAWCQYIQSILEGLKHPVSGGAFKLVQYHISMSRAVPMDVANDRLFMTALETFCSDASSPQLSARIHERHIRVMKFYIPEVLQNDVVEINNRIHQISNMEFNHEALLGSASCLPAISEQYTDLLETLFSLASAVHCVPAAATVYALDVLPAFQFLVGFMEIASRVQELPQVQRTLMCMNQLAQRDWLDKSGKDPENPIAVAFCMGYYVGLVCSRLRESPLQWCSKDDLDITELFVFLSHFVNNRTAPILKIERSGLYNREAHIYSLCVDECEKVTRLLYPSPGARDIHSESLKNEESANDHEVESRPRKNITLQRPIFQAGRSRRHGG